MITRRRLLIALGLNALVISTSTPSANAAPPPGKVLRIGLLDVVYESFDPDSDSVHRALLDGLRAHGYELGRNFMLEFRSARGNPERLAELAAELVRLKVDLLIPVFTQPTLAAREATKTIPIVMLGATDPVATGVVASLARPGGNITGVSVNAAEISAKRVQLIKEAVPKISRVAVLWNSTLKSMTIGFQQIEMAAPSLGVTIQSIRVSGSGELDKAFAAISQGHPGGLIILFGPMRGNDLPRIVEFVTVWPKRQGPRAPYRRLRGQDREWCETSRSACGGTDQLRVDHQLKSRQDNGPDHSPVAAGARRQTDQINKCRSISWTK